MELYQLRTFVTVAQQGHLTQAAELLHLSQPAVTAQIKALEEEVGLALFERGAGGVKLTRVGQELLPHAQTVLSAARDFLHHSQLLKGRLNGRALIGTISASEMSRLGPWLAELTTRHPLLDLQLQHNVTGIVLSKVRKKEVDAGFYIGNNPYVNVTAVKLASLRYRLVASTQWQEKIASLTPRELGKLPWVGLSQFSSLSRLTNELWRELNISPKTVAEVDHVSTTASLVHAGVGLALLREDEACAMVNQGRLVMVPDVVKTCDLQFIYLSEREGEPVMQALLAALEDVWREPAA